MPFNVNLKNVNLISKRGIWLTSNFDLRKEMILQKFRLK